MIIFNSHSHPSEQRSQGMETTCPSQKLQDGGSAPGVTIEPGVYKKHIKLHLLTETVPKETALYSALLESECERPYSTSCDLLPWPLICLRMDTGSKGNQPQAGL